VSGANEPAERVAVGRITRAHGVHGAVLVLPLSEVPERFDPGSSLLLGETGERRVTVVERRGHKDRPLLRLEEVPDRTAAEAIAGEYLFVAASESPELPPGEFWPHELIGMRVVTTSGMELGEVQDVVRTVANDVWIARDADGRESLIPALRDIVIDVDRVAALITVAEVPGLTVPEAPA
jgi:16S rRNA processing protein RimM